MAAVSVNLGLSDVVRAVTALRSAAPPVRCLVGPDVEPLAARVLAAAGATAARGAEVAGAVLVGLGSMDEAGVLSAEVAAAAAHEQGTRWVLDPDTASGPAWLARSALGLLAARPAVVRGTAAELHSLAAGGQRVDGAHSVEHVFHAVNELARRTGAVVAVGGEVDLVTDGERCVRIEGGHPGLARVPGVGTGLAALVAAHLAVTEDAVLAAVAAHAQVAAAAEVAASSADGPEAWVAALAVLDPEAIAERVRLV